MKANDSVLFFFLLSSSTCFGGLRLVSVVSTVCRDCCCFFQQKALALAVLVALAVYLKVNPPGSSVCAPHTSTRSLLRIQPRLSPLLTVKDEGRPRTSREAPSL